MNIPSQELELIESISYLDTKQKTDVLKFVKEQLLYKHRSIVKKEALRDIRTALKRV